MKLSTAKSIQTWSICAAFLVFMLAAFTEYELMQNVFFVISVVFLVSGLIIMLLFWPLATSPWGAWIASATTVPTAGRSWISIERESP